jgi:hypothetical protein
MVHGFYTIACGHPARYCTTQHDLVKVEIPPVVENSAILSEGN